MKKRLVALFLGLTLMVIALAGCTSGNDGDGELADDFPNKPIEFALTVSPGGASDISARLVAQLMSKHLGVDVRVVNMPGGSGAVCLEYVNKQPADGYIVFNAANSLVSHTIKGTSPITLENYEAIGLTEIDPRWIATVVGGKFDTIEELIEYAQDNEVTIGGSMVDNQDHLPIWLMGQQWPNVKYVPFDSTSEVLAAAMGGHIDAMIASIGPLLPLMENDEVKLLCIFHDERTDKYPDVPTGKEAGIDISTAVYRGFGVKAGTPPERVEILREALAKAVAEPEYKEYVEKSNLDIVDGVRIGEEFAETFWELHGYYEEFLNRDE
ncbi:MAG: tripartite tricarboxylate transporter substrate binding protein [Firmicutes bacterium]|nr:tripartite tricarboxylate transporter substrate binding protein [Bacillota bacterium]